MRPLGSGLLGATADALDAAGRPCMPCSRAAQAVGWADDCPFTPTAPRSKETPAPLLSASCGELTHRRGAGFAPVTPNEEAARVQGPAWMRRCGSGAGYPASSPCCRRRGVSGLGVAYNKAPDQQGGGVGRVGAGGRGPRFAGRDCRPGSARPHPLSPPARRRIVRQSCLGTHCVRGRGGVSGRGAGLAQPASAVQPQRAARSVRAAPLSSPFPRFLVWVHPIHPHPRAGRRTRHELATLPSSSAASAPPASPTSGCSHRVRARAQAGPRQLWGPGEPRSSAPPRNTAPFGTAWSSQP